MSDVSIRTQIKKLVDLQKIDFEIYNFKGELKEKPDFIAQMKERFESGKEGLKKLEEKLKAFLLDRKAKELELQAKEGDIAKANTQLSSLKTNKEYQAKMLKIEHIKADKSVIEEKILMLFDDADQVNALIVQEKTKVAEEEKKFFAQKSEIDALIKELQDKLKVMEINRNQIVPEINPAQLSRYERILENKDGLALVPIKNHCCGGCFMNVPEQVINEMKMHDRFISCEMCARLLYLEDDL